MLSGYQCELTCPTGYVATGKTRCVKGVIVEQATCSLAPTSAPSNAPTQTPNKIVKLAYTSVDFSDMSSDEVASAVSAVQSSFLAANPALSAANIAYIFAREATSRRRVAGTLEVEVGLTGAEADDATVNAANVGANFAVGGAPSATYVGTVTIHSVAPTASPSVLSASPTATAPTTAAPTAAAGDSSTSADTSIGAGVIGGIVAAVLVIVGIGAAIAYHHKQQLKALAQTPNDTEMQWSKAIPVTTLRRGSDQSNSYSETLQREAADEPGRASAPGGFKSVKRANPIYKSEHVVSAGVPEAI